MFEQMALDDRLEQMNAQKRRMKELEHKKAVELLLQERRDQNAKRKVRVILLESSGCSNKY